jgi:hypothetical protein
MKNVTALFCSCELAIQLRDNEATITAKEVRIAFFICPSYLFTAA